MDFWPEIDRGSRVRGFSEATFRSLFGLKVVFWVGQNRFESELAVFWTGLLLVKIGLLSQLKMLFWIFFGSKKGGQKVAQFLGKFGAFLGDQAPFGKNGAPFLGQILAKSASGFCKIFPEKIRENFLGSGFLWRGPSPGSKIGAFLGKVWARDR
mgnify:CR=1 FL=1